MQNASHLAQAVYLQLRERADDAGARAKRLTEKADEADSIAAANYLRHDATFQGGLQCGLLTAMHILQLTDQLDHDELLKAASADLYQAAKDLGIEL